VKGKTIICLVNDPGFVDPNLFEGRTMTYYGRWTYKFEEAARQHAAAVFVIHEEESAGYPWAVQANGKQAYFQIPISYYLNSIQGWMTTEAARKLFGLVGLNFDEEKRKAATTNFNSYSLNLSLSSKIEQRITNFQSKNLLAILKGKTEETIYYSAHYDHFGIKDNEIYAGARDNALGVASLIELAFAFSKINKQHRDKTVIFFSPTGEESGLLGSAYYCENPLFPLERAKGCINFDIMNIFGPTNDITFYGWGKSPLEEYVEKGTKLQQRVIKGDPVPQNGMFYRSDHFNFHKKGVPVLFPNMGFDHSEIEEKDYILTLNNQWTKECYHKPLDVVVIDENSKWCWDLRGAVQDIQLTLFVGLELLIK